MKSRMKVLLVGAAMAVLLFTMAGVAWADHHRTPPGPPLRITDAAPDGGTTGVSTTPTITIFFDKDMNSSSVMNGNVTLKKVGTRKAFTPSHQSYDLDQEKYTGDMLNLEPNTTYKVIVDGGLDGVRSTDGGKLGGVDDPSARFMDGKVFWKFTTAP